MNEMYKSGAISKKVFSIYITNYFDSSQANINSKISIGGYNLAKYAKGGLSITWNNLKNKSYWSLNLIAAKLANSTFNFETDALSAIVDSGTSYVMMPTSDYDRLIKHFASQYGINFKAIKQKTKIKKM